MTKETARTISAASLIGGILIILATCGVCCTGKTTYGPEEFYDRGDGSVGYGARSYSDNTDALALMLFVGGPLCVILFIVSAGFHAHAENLPSTAAAMKREARMKRGSMSAPASAQPESEEYEPDHLGGLPGLNDPLFEKALTQTIVDKRASVVRLQRELNIGYNRAAAILDAMSVEGLISKMDIETRSFPILPKAYERLKDIASRGKDDGEANPRDAD